MSLIATRVTSRAEVLSRLKSLEPQLRARGLTALFLFGSAARDEARPDSDVDVFAEFAPGARLGWDFAGAPDVLSQGLGRSVDFAMRDGLHPLLRADIEREAIQVF